MKDLLPRKWLSDIAGLLGNHARRCFRRAEARLEARRVRLRNKPSNVGGIAVRGYTKTIRRGLLALRFAISGLIGALSGVVTMYLFLNASLSIIPGEVLNPDDPMSAPFVVTNTSSFWSLMNGTLDCQVNGVSIVNHPSYNFTNNDVGGYAPPIPELGPGGQDTVYCAGDRRALDFGPIESADVTITFLYKFPYHVPCHGMKWQRYRTLSSRDGKLRWSPIGMKNAPVPTEMVLRSHFYCGSLLWYAPKPVQH